MPPAPKPLIKPQKACVLCRRSKVKCIHEGGPPCKRCQDNKTDCKFRLRADDEDWRERTDETLNRLEGSVDFLMQHHSSCQNNRAATPTAAGPSHGRVETTHAPASSPRSPRVVTKQSPFHDVPSTNTYHPYPPPRGHSTPSSSASLVSTRCMGTDRASSYIGPYDGAPPINGARPSSTKYLGFDGASGLLSQSEPQLCGMAAHTRVGITYVGLARGSILDPGFSQNPQPDQTRPSRLIALAQEPAAPRFHHRHTAAEGHASIAAISPYARPTRFIGRDDPRLTVISMGLVSMDTACHLFMFFARHLQPHSFGFPSYPANEGMTPLIIASILTVASMHEPSTRHLHDRLRHEAFAALNVDQEITRDSVLDPELGIGVEEITGACIAACWLGGRAAFKVARIARWWAVSYLKHFEVRSAQTLGEWMTILPPFRQIDLVEKLRIWLMSYVTEAQQAVIHDMPSLIAESNPAQYCEGLLNSARNSSQLKNGTSPPASATNPASATAQVSPSDRQLVAHARIMWILLTAQEVQREVQRRMAEAKTHSPTEPRSASREAAAANNAYDTRMLFERWRELLDELEAWKLATAQHEEPTLPISTSHDLSLLYHLTSTYLSTLLLSPTHPTPLPCKHSALFSLHLLLSPHYSSRLTTLPNFYHFLIGHTVGFLLLLVRNRDSPPFVLTAEEDEILFETTQRFVEKYSSGLQAHGFVGAHASPQGGYNELPQGIATGQAEIHQPQPQNGVSKRAGVAVRHPALLIAQELAKALYTIKMQRSIDDLA
ncbi:hypothetical protein ACQY0O_008330 [Thecaphora frezii]